MNSVFAQLNALFGKISLAKKIVLFALIGGVSFGFYMLMSWSNQPDYQIIYSGLMAEDAGKVIEKLKTEKIQYKLSNDGTSILIPADKIYETRMLLASYGLPQGGGIGFELFDNVKLGMTEFVQNINYQRALQGELSRTINQFDEVESSRIHIVMSKKSLFLDEKEPATASIVIKLRPGAFLKRRQIQGISFLVSSSISGLEPQNVTIVDNYGNMLSGFDTEDSLRSLGLDQLAYQEKIERKIENRIKTMLNSALGRGKAIVRLSCTINFKRQERTEEKYLPENKVVRSEQKLKQISNKPQEIPIGIPGQASYSYRGKNKINTKNNEIIFERQDESSNYEIGKIISHIVEPVGEIKKLSVAVLVDGSYQTIKNKKGKEEKKYIPRSPEEMAQIESLVKRAVNFDPARNDEVEVVNIPFQVSNDEEMVAEEPVGGIKSILDSYKEFIKYGLAAVLFIFIYLVVIRPVITWLTSYTPSESEIIPQLPMTVNEIENGYSGKKSLSFRDKAENLIKSEKQASATVIKEWIKQT